MSVHSKGMSQAFRHYQPSNGVRALAITPHQHDLAYLRSLFYDARWVLYEAAGCSDALSAIRRTPLDLVITERNLPDGDWRRILRALQDMPSVPPLIVTSRLADEYLWAEVLNEGGYDILVQPFEREEALRVISAATRRGNNEKARQRPSARRVLSAGA